MPDFAAQRLNLDRSIVAGLDARAAILLQNQGRALNARVRPLGLGKMPWLGKKDLLVDGIGQLRRLQLGGAQQPLLGSATDRDVDHRRRCLAVLSRPRQQRERIGRQGGGAEGANGIGELIVVDCPRHQVPKLVCGLEASAEMSSLLCARIRDQLGLLLVALDTLLHEHEDGLLPRYSKYPSWVGETPDKPWTKP